MKIRKFNEGVNIGDKTGMEYLTKEEFEKRKSDIIEQITILKESYGEFTKMVSPSNWRSTGRYFSQLDSMIADVYKCEKLSKSDLSNEWVRKAILGDDD